MLPQPLPQLAPPVEAPPVKQEQAARVPQLRQLAQLHADGPRNVSTSPVSFEAAAPPPSATHKQSGSAAPLPIPGCWQMLQQQRRQWLLQQQQWGGASASAQQWAQWAQDCSAGGADSSCCIFQPNTPDTTDVCTGACHSSGSAAASLHLLPHQAASPFASGTHHAALQQRQAEARLFAARQAALRGPSAARQLEHPAPSGVQRGDFLGWQDLESFLPLC
jgi:hypothetical protein